MGMFSANVSDHYSQFCILHSVKGPMFNPKTKKKRDFSNFSENDFMADLSHINFDCNVQNNADRSLLLFIQVICDVIAGAWGKKF